MGESLCKHRLLACVQRAAPLSKGESKAREIVAITWGLCGVYNFFLLFFFFFAAIGCFFLELCYRKNCKGEKSFLFYFYQGK